MEDVTAFAMNLFQEERVQMASLRLERDRCGGSHGFRERFYSLAVEQDW